MALHSPAYQCTLSSTEVLRRLGGFENNPFTMSLRAAMIAGALLLAVAVGASDPIKVQLRKQMLVPEQRAHHKDKARLVTVQPAGGAAHNDAEPVPITNFMDAQVCGGPSPMITS